MVWQGLCSRALAGLPYACPCVSSFLPASLLALPACRICWISFPCCMRASEKDRRTRARPREAHGSGVTGSRQARACTYQHSGRCSRSPNPAQAQHTCFSLLTRACCSYVVKGGEDVRLDARMQQLFSAMNGVAAHHPGACLPASLLGVAHVLYLLVLGTAAYCYAPAVGS